MGERVGIKIENVKNGFGLDGGSKLLEYVDRLTFRIAEARS